MESNRCHQSESSKEEVTESIPNKGVSHSIKLFVEEVDNELKSSNEHAIENLEVASKLDSGHELVGKVCEKIIVIHESVSNIVELEHEVKTEGIELGKEMKNSDEMSAKSSELI